MIGHLGYRVCHNRVSDPDVPGPELVELVAPLISRRPLSEGWGESSLGQGGVHFIELPIEIPTQNDLGGWVLPNDALS